MHDTPTGPKGPKTIDQMSDDELIAEIARLQAIRIEKPNERKPAVERKARGPKDPAKRRWQDDFFQD